MASRQRSGEPDSTPGGCALGLHEELSTNGPQEPPKRCVCGPEHLRLRSEHGELVKPRGKSVNRCDYCAKLAAVENCEMLALDAAEGDAPTVLIVLGTRTATVDMPRFYDGLREVKRALKRRWPAFEYASLLEFTTGYGERSGGLRRPHWNLMSKGIPSDQLDAAAAIAFPIWCRHVDAEVQAQDVRPIYAAEGLTKYLALHFQKASQQPPEGFTGQRFNCSLGYFTGCTRATARARARESLALKREVWKQLQRDDAYAPTNAHDVELNAQLAYRRAAATRWILAAEDGSPLNSDGPMATVDVDVVARLAAEGRMPAARTVKERIRALTADRSARRAVVAPCRPASHVPCPLTPAGGSGASEARRKPPA